MLPITWYRPSLWRPVVMATGDGLARGKIMSTSLAKERVKRRAVLLKHSRAVNASLSGFHGVNQSARFSSSSVVGSPSRRSLSLGGGSKVLEKRPAARVLDEDGDDVTPLPLLQPQPQPEAGASQVKASRFFVEELSAGSASEQTTTNTATTGSFAMPFSRSVFGSSRISSQSTMESVNEESEDAFPKRDAPVSLPDVQRRRDAAGERVTEDMLKQAIDVAISETDTLPLLDIPGGVVSADAEDARAVTERNSLYAEACRSRLHSDKYADRATQTLSGALKSKQVQSVAVATADTAVMVTSWDVFDASCGSEQQDGRRSPETERPQGPQGPERAERTVGAAERSESVGSIASTGSAASSLRDLEMPAAAGGPNAEADLQLMVQSERFQHSLLVMTRSLLLNTLQHELAAYRQLPVLRGPDSPAGPSPEGPGGQEDSGRAPALEPLWAFGCELSRGRSVSSMAWNKKNPDLLAVGYGALDSSNQKPGLVCCWSLKNSTWPERVVRCESAVTSLDFSASDPSHLAVGMQDGGIAVYNVQGPGSAPHVTSSRECPDKHRGPVWQLRWTRQERGAGEDGVETLLSVAADGRISKWFLCNGGLDCLDLMKLKRIRNSRKAGGNKADMNAESVLSALTPGLCLDLHPTDPSVYLAGTWEGLIYKCSCSSSEQFLDVYRKHFCPVNRIAWCPLSPDVFLSCSSDWTIQLWKQDLLSPVFSFASNQRAVCDVKWSPKWATVFGAINEAQLEIWDLNSSILDPLIVQPAVPGVKMTCLLFASQADCVLAGDTDGQVTVFQLKNLGLGEDSQADLLESIIRSAISS